MSNSPYFTYALLGLAAGALIPVMAALSGALGRESGNPNMAALIVVLGAFVMVLAYTTLTGAARAPLTILAQASPLQLVSGFSMAFYLLTITFLAPRFGVGNAVMFVVAAQIASSALIDHFGLFGAPQKPVSMLRLAGLAVMASGVVIAQTASNAPLPRAD